MAIWKALRVTGFVVSFAASLCVLALIGSASEHGGFERVVAHYPFDGTAEDVSGGGLHGLVVGALPIEGIVGHALLFDGADDYVEIPKAAFNGILRGAVSFWIRPAAGAPTTALVAKSGGWDIMYKETFEHETISGVRIDLNGKLRCTHHNFWIDTGADVVSRGRLPAGTWTHVVWTWNGSRQYLYLDGRLNSSVENPDGVASDLAGWVRFGMGWTYFSGAIDDIWIFRQTLTLEEVQRLMEMGTQSG
jgi:hypothetical protein